MSCVINHQEGTNYKVFLTSNEIKEISGVTQISRDADMGFLILIADKTYIFNSENVAYFEVQK